MTVAPFSFLFFFNDTATTEIYTLSLHDALPICLLGLSDCICNGEGASGLAFAYVFGALPVSVRSATTWEASSLTVEDRKSTRLNSSHLVISYAVFCLKKKKN